MQSISTLIKKKQHLSPIWKGVAASLIVEKANEITADFIGTEARNQAKAVYYKNKILTFACLSSVYAQEIKLFERSIKDKINQVFGQNTVEKFRYLD